MTIQHQFTPWALLVMIILASCTGGGREEVPGTVAAQDSGVVLTSLQVRNAGITYGSITRQRLSFDIRAKGKLSLPPDHEASVSSMTGGVVTSVLVRQGEHVGRGKVLALISSPGIITLQQDYLSASNRYRLAETEYNRQKELRRDGITSDKAFLEAETQFNELSNSREALRLNLELLNIPVAELQKGTIRQTASVVSPIDGDIEHIYINLGKSVTPDDILFSVVNKNRLYLELMVFEKDVPFVTPGQRVTFEMANLGDKEYEAHVVTISRTVEEDARTVRVLADFVNDSPYLLPGMFVAAEIHTAEQEVDALPEEAIVEDQNGSYLYYTLSGDGEKEQRFFRLPCKTGFREDNFIQVKPLTTLPAGARVVVTGAYYVKSEGLKSSE